MRNNKFITIEGIDGAGKSSCMKFIVESILKNQPSASIVQTREPGGTKLGEGIRELFLFDECTGDSDILLAFAARSDHMNKVIAPNLENDSWVISDRFVDSTYAYQGYASSDPEERIAKIKQLDQMTVGDLHPKLTILLDIDPVLARPRLIETGKIPDNFESQVNSDFFNKARDGYLSLAKNEPERYKVVDASLNPEEIRDIIQSIIEEHILLIHNTQSNEVQANKRYRI